MFSRTRLKFLIQGISDPHLRDCLHYFSKNTEKDLLVLKSNPRYSKFVDGFNLNDISIEKIISESDLIKQNPYERIPIVLGFDRIPSESYYDFIIEMAHENTWNSTDISNFIVHIYRFVVCLIRRMDSSLLEVSHTDDNFILKCISLTIGFSYHFPQDVKD